MSDGPHTTDDEGRLDAILRSLTDEDLRLETPPESVWAGIESSLSAGSAVQGESSEGEAIAPVIDLASRRRTPLLVGAVAAALLLVGGLAVILNSGDDDNSVEFASAELAFVPNNPAFVPLGAGHTAAVTLLGGPDDETVRVDSADLPDAPDGSDLEIWLIGFAGDQADIVSLGLVEDPSAPGTFTVPDDFDRAAYDTVAVDVSVEPNDGVETHSGMSLVRGTLT